ncbi:MAG: hypothetical protein KAU31_05455, partial [Spirochaetaceae bacterium]|nr:hypothetical protein [Spirochaetaceae bacterium]
MSRHLALVALLVCAVAGAGFTRGRPEGTEIDWDALEIGAELTVTGKLSVYGNEPHTYLAVAVEDPASPSGICLVQVEGERFGELYRLQGQTVTITGTVSR